MRAFITCVFCLCLSAPQAISASDALKVVFVCQYGYAKSLVAAKHFERMAAERGVPVQVSARGLTPKAAVPATIAAPLRADGLPVDGYAPVALTASDVADADVVIAFGVDIPHPSKALVRRWDDVGGLTEDYPGARDMIRLHLRVLLDEIARGQP